MVQHQLLTKDEEYDLITRAQGGDFGARDRMVEANMRLVFDIARRYRRPSTIDLEDLTQVGVLGMLRAIELFQVEKGYRFSTYATYWIRQAITRYLETHYYTIRLPIHRFHQLGRLDAAEERLHQADVLSPTAEELAQESKLAVRTVKELMSMPRGVLSLDVQAESGDCDLHDIIGELDAMYHEAEQGLLCEAVIQCLDQLPDRERWVLRGRFGLETGVVRTLQELATERGLSREGVRHIESRAIRRLRHLVRDNPSICEIIAELDGGNHPLTCARSSAAALC